MRLYPSDDSTQALAIRRKSRLKKNKQPKDFKTLKEYFEQKKTQRRSGKSTQVRQLVPLETQEQAQLIRWKCLYERQIPALAHLFAIPNQGAARLKSLQMEGTLRGVSDLFLSYPVAPFHGLYIEMKRVKGGKVSPEQYAFIALQTSVGYAAEACRGAEEAWKLILTYLGEKDPR